MEEDAAVGVLDIFFENARPSQEVTVASFMGGKGGYL